MSDAVIEVVVGEVVVVEVVEPVATVVEVSAIVGPQGVIGETGPTGADSTVPGPTGLTGPTGPAGVVQSVVAGTNVTVNSTDPANPVVSSTSDFVGPASATDSGVALFDGVTGKLIKNSSSFVQIAGGNVGIGTTVPGAKLDVLDASTKTAKIRTTTGVVGAQLLVLDYPNGKTIDWVAFKTNNETYTYGTIASAAYALSIKAQFNVQLSPGSVGGIASAGVTVGYNDYIVSPAAKVGIKVGETYQVGLNVLGISGQTADLQRWGLYTSGDGVSGGIFYTTLAKITNVGGAYFAGNVGIGTDTPTASLDIPASTTAKSSLRIRTGVAPTSPNDGDIWLDGTDMKIRIGGVTKTVTIT